MRRFMLVAAMLGSVSAAQAADMPDLPILRGGFTDGLSASRTSWQGYYVGGQVDYGNIKSNISPVMNSDLQATFKTPGPTYSWWQLPAEAKSNNTGFGAFAGYNGQWDDVVLGIEANYSHFGFKSTAASTGRTWDNANNIISTTASSAIVGISDFGSLRARAGYAWGCFLPYAFFGGGVGYQTVDRAVSASPPPVLPATTSASQSKLVYGYSAGLGVDVMLMGGLFVRAEYEFQRVTSSIESNINTIRAGLGYKF
ncbi:porin family protein [Bradyrhizobium manausense]|uniref:outer membrane protein n=1 Tax=Bradyrhizobium TaxID=374 RepID=UPI001BA7947D|nr:MULTISPECIES: outer membrane beta-barrel protein [Bradyrhizobium]MBR0830866.1 porin family protein [Bradyrhizobium manausense]UVO27822.1 outer membrane beta-barrel protein [Bradyrhizobium arachidis]